MTPEHPVQANVASAAGWVGRYRYLRSHWYAEGATFPRCGTYRDLERGPRLTGRPGVSFDPGIGPASACRQCVLGILADVVKSALARGAHA